LPALSETEPRGIDTYQLNPNQCGSHAAKAYHEALDTPTVARTHRHCALQQRSELGIHTFDELSEHVVIDGADEVKRLALTERLAPWSETL
jgi:hypothetical protein